MARTVGIGIQMLKGKRLCTEIDEQIIFNQLDHNENAIWSLFLASGYLKADKHNMDEESGKEEYKLTLTNKEVRIMFEKMIKEWFAQSAGNIMVLLKHCCRETEKK